MPEDVSNLQHGFTTLYTDIYGDKGFPTFENDFEKAVALESAPFNTSTPLAAAQAYDEHNAAIGLKVDKFIGAGNQALVTKPEGTAQIVSRADFSGSAVMPSPGILQPVYGDHFSWIGKVITSSDRKPDKTGTYQDVYEFSERKLDINTYIVARANNRNLSYNDTSDQQNPPNPITSEEFINLISVLKAHPLVGSDGKQLIKEEEINVDGELRKIQVPQTLAHAGFDMRPTVAMEFTAVVNGEEKKEILVADITTFDPNKNLSGLGTVNAWLAERRESLAADIAELSNQQSESYNPDRAAEVRRHLAIIPTSIDDIPTATPARLKELADFQTALAAKIIPEVQAQLTGNAKDKVKLPKMELGAIVLPDFELKLTLKYGYAENLYNNRDYILLLSRLKTALGRNNVGDHTSSKPFIIKMQRNNDDGVDTLEAVITGPKGSEVKVKELIDYSYKQGVLEPRKKGRV